MMASKERPAAFALVGGAVLCFLTLVAFALLWSDEPAWQVRASQDNGRPTVVPSPAGQPSGLGVAVNQPSALVKPPTRLALEAYELTPETFLAWKNFIAGDPKSHFWERIAWRTTLWDAVVDAHEQDKPILLEIHGGNALGRC
jgi:hypothetical protein